MNRARVAVRGDGHTAEQPVRDIDRRRSRNAHHRDAAPAGRGRDRRDRVVGPGKLHGPVGVLRAPRARQVSPTIFFVITHC